MTFDVADLGGLVRSSPQELRQRLEWAASSDQGAKLARWLLPLKTEFVEHWARESPAVSRTIQFGEPRGKFVLRFLLRRHILHLHSRRKRDGLIDFWRWATAPCDAKVLQLWDQVDFSPCVGSSFPSVQQQEEHFASILRDMAMRVVSLEAPDWACEELSDLSNARGMHNLAFAPKAIAQVAFASNTTESPLRSGLLVAFELLPGNDRILNSPELFDSEFHYSIHQIQMRLGSAFRAIEHAWGFLNERGCLQGSSGTMAIGVSQWLAGGGPQLQGRAWTLPPWLVVSASLNPAASIAGGAADRVERLIEKAMVLVEEGVRILAVADPLLKSPIPASEYFQDRERRAEIPGLRDLWIMPISGNFERVGQGLVDQECVWPFDPGPFQKSLFPQAFSDHHIDDRDPAHWPHFEYQSDYVRPDYAINAITSAIKELPGQGCIHVMADGGMGKTVLADALRRGADGTSLSNGRVIGYTILRGHPEDPGAFLEEIHFQATGLGKGGRPLHGLPDPHVQMTWIAVQAAVRQLLEVAQVKACRDVPLILVIDGLDELSQFDNTDKEPLILRVLPSADELPSNCFVALLSGISLRPAVERALMRVRGTGNSFRPVRLTRENTEYRRMLNDYVRKSFPSTHDSEVESLLERAQYSFLYLRFQRDLLRLLDPELRMRNAAPEGDEIFPAFLEQLALTISDDVDDVAFHETVLGLIAVAHEPIGRTHLHNWLDTDENNADEQHRLNLALDQISSLIHKDLSQDLSTDNSFMLAHRELTRWFHETTHQYWSNVVQASRRRILAHLKKPGWFLQPSPEDNVHDEDGSPHRLHPLENYRLRHRPSHLMDLGDWAGAREALSDPEAIRLDDVLIGLRTRQRFWRHLLPLLDGRIAQLRRLIDHHGGINEAASVIPFIVQRLGLVYVRHGRVFDTQHQAPIGIASLNRALDVLPALRTQSETTEAAIARFEHFLTIYVEAWHHLGSCYHQQMFYGDALKAYQRAAEAMEQIVTRCGGLDRACELNEFCCDLLSENYQSQADILLRQLHLSDADAAFNRAGEIAYSLMRYWDKQEDGIAGTPKRSDSLASKFRGGAAHLLRMRFYKSAADLYGHSIGLLDECVTARGTKRSLNIAPDRVLLLAQCYRERALALPDPAGSEDLERSEELLNSLVHHFRGVELCCQIQPDIAHALAESRRDLATRLMHNSAFVQAEDKMREAVELLQSLVSYAGGLEDAVAMKPQLVHTLGQCLGGLGDLHKRRAQAGISNHASRYYCEAKSVLEVVAAHVSRTEPRVDSHLHFDLARLQHTIGHYELVEGHFEQALQILQSGIASLRSLIAQAGGATTVITFYPDIADSLQGTFGLAASAASALNQPAIAVELLQCSITLLEHFRRHSPEPNYERDSQLLSRLAERAGALENSGRRSDAMRSWCRVARLGRNFVASLVCSSASEIVTHDSDLAEILFSAHVNYGQHLMLRQKWVEAIEELTRAMQLFTAIIEGLERTPIRRVSLSLLETGADSERHLAEAFIQSSDWQQAVRYSRQSRERYLRLLKANEGDSVHLLSYLRLVDKVGLVTEQLLRTLRQIGDKLAFVAAAEELADFYAEIVHRDHDLNRALCQHAPLVATLALSRAQFADALHDAENFDRASQIYQEAVPLLDNCILEEPVEKVHENRWATFARWRIRIGVGWGILLHAPTRVEQAHEQYEIAVELGRQFISTAGGPVKTVCGDPETFRSIMFAMLMLGRAEAQLRHPKVAVAVFEDILNTLAHIPVALRYYVLSDFVHAHIERISLLEQFGDRDHISTSIESLVVWITTVHKSIGDELTSLLGVDEIDRVTEYVTSFPSANIERLPVAILDEWSTVQNLFKTA